MSTTSDSGSPAGVTGMSVSVRVFIAFLMVACAALSLIVMRLVGVNRELGAKVTQMMELAAEDALPLGEALESLPSFGSADAAGGHPDLLNFTDGRLGTLLFIHNSNCPACVEMMPRISALRAKLNNSGVELVGIQTDAKAGADLKHAEYGFAIRGVPELRSTWLKHNPVVPNLLLVDNEGVLRGRWPGVLESEREREMLVMLDRALGGWAQRPAKKPAAPGTGGGADAGRPGPG